MSCNVVSGDTIAVVDGRWRSPVRRVLVQGPSMAATLRDGDQVLVWTVRRPRPRAGAVVVVDLPGQRGLGVKRVRAVEPDGSLWVEGDNPFGSTDSRQLGPAQVIAVARLRLWPRPGRLPRRDPDSDPGG